MNFCQNFVSISQFGKDCEILSKFCCLYCEKLSVGSGRLSVGSGRLSVGCARLFVASGWLSGWVDKSGRRVGQKGG